MRKATLLLTLAALLLTATAARAAESETFHGIPLPPGAEKAEPATWEPPVGPDESEWGKIDRQAYKTGLSFRQIQAFYHPDMRKLGWQDAGDPQMNALAVLAWSSPLQAKASKVWVAYVPPGNLPAGEDYDLLLTFGENPREGYTVGDQ